jgi:acyl-CoA dehydrogenase
MSTYRAPMQEMQFVLNELAGLEQVGKLPGYEDATPDTVAAILEEASKFADRGARPLNAGRRPRRRDMAGRREGQDGHRLQGRVSPLRREWLERPDQESEHGGQGLPQLVATAVEEMWHGANMAFALCPLLTQGAIEALELCGSDKLKSTYLSKMVEGVWTGTMNLTEPQAGSDLAAVRTRAVPSSDQPGGAYKLYGQKIFITYGEQDYTDNIIHLVLARTPTAPEGVKGISLFLVPKFLVNDDGSLGARNDVQCVSIEHKLGIHASPTAVLAYGDHGGAVRLPGRRRESRP